MVLSNHNSYLLFVIVTFYTVSKINVLCGSTEQKVGLTKGWTYVNLLLSTITFAGGLYWLSVYDTRVWPDILSINGPFHIFAALMTILFLHYDFFCCASCCCECCIGEEQVVIHDPCNPASNLVWTNGQVCILYERLPLKYILSILWIHLSGCRFGQLCRCSSACGGGGTSGTVLLGSKCCLKWNKIYFLEFKYCICI